MYCLSRIIKYDNFKIIITVIPTTGDILYALRVMLNIWYSLKWWWKFSFWCEYPILYIFHINWHRSRFFIALQLRSLFNNLFLDLPATETLHHNNIGRASILIITYFIGLFFTFPRGLQWHILNTLNCFPQYNSPLLFLSISPSTIFSILSW